MSDFFYICGMANGERPQLPSGSAAFRQNLHSAIVDTQARSGKAPKSSNTLYDRGVDYYRDSSGNISSPPSYPDTSYSAYLAQGGNILGIGYFAWRDRLVNNYQMAYNEYQNYYNSAAQQKFRLAEAGLNTNLAYGSVSPGQAAGSPGGASSSPSPLDVATGASSIIGGVVGNLKTLAEAATIVAALPESKFKGNLFKQLDAAALAGKLNSEAIYTGQLNNARIAAGIPTSQANKERITNALVASQNDAEQQYLDYVTSHDSEGNEVGFSDSLFVGGRSSELANDQLTYLKNKKEFDELISDPLYFKSLLNKMVNESYLTYSQAYSAYQIISSPGNSPFDKALMLQSGLPGLIFKIIGFINSEREQKKKPPRSFHVEPGDPNRKPGSIPDNSNWPEGIFNH